jgi:hypothetical protein
MRQFVRILCLISFAVITAAGVNAKPIDEQPYEFETAPVFEFELQRLSEGFVDRVVVTGPRDRGGWVTVCTGDGCADLFRQDVNQMHQALAGLRIDPQTALILVEAIKLSACSSNPKLTSQTKVSTSTDSLEARVQAATNIIDTALGARTVGSSVYSFLTRTPNDPKKTPEFTVEFSDGGTEVYIYVPTSSVFFPKEGTLKQGDGQPGSACKAKG